MPIPTNSELFNCTDPSYPIARLEYLPNPSVAFEEHFNTATDIELRRLRWILDNGFGKNILVEAGTDADDTFVRTNNGDIWVDPFKMISGYYMVQIAASAKVNATPVPIGTTFVVLSIIESIHTYENYPSEVGLSYNAQTVSGPNRYWYNSTLSLVSSIPADADAFPPRTGTVSRYIPLATIVCTGTSITQITVTQSVRRVLKVGDFLTEDFYAKWLEVLGTDVVSPNNLRIYDVLPSAHGLALTLKWNWDDFGGIGGIGIFTTTNLLTKYVGGSATNISFSDVEGMYLQINGTSYIISNCIVSGPHHQLSITNVDGSAVDLSGVTVTSSRIYNDVDYYEVVAVQMLADDVTHQGWKETVITATTTLDTVDLTQQLGIAESTKYRFYITGVRKNVRSTTHEMQAGAYIPGVSTSKTALYASASVSYAIPVNLTAPTVKLGSAAVTVASGAAGFTISIATGSGSTDGWKLVANGGIVTDYEVCWVDSTIASADFTNPTQPRAFFGGGVSAAFIPVAAYATYSIAVRPYSGGSVVYTAGIITTLAVSAGTYMGAVGGSGLIKVTNGVPSLASPGGDYVVPAEVPNFNDIITSDRYAENIYQNGSSLMRFIAITMGLVGAPGGGFHVSDWEIKIGINVSALSVVAHLANSSNSNLTNIAQACFIVPSGWYYQLHHATNVNHSDSISNWVEWFVEP